jgi:hypothetical protein
VLGEPEPDLSGFSPDDAVPSVLEGKCDRLQGAKAVSDEEDRSFVICFFDHCAESLAADHFKLMSSQSGIMCSQ